MKPEEYARLGPVERATWVLRLDPATPDDEQLVLADHDPYVRVHAAAAHLSEAALRRLHDEGDDEIKEIVGTNQWAPLDLIGSVPVSKQIGSSVAAYVERTGLTEAERDVVGALVDAGAQDARPLAQAIAEASSGEAG